MPEANVSNPAVEPVQEVRMALVLYGGVSLAIYIAGVVREIHRLVRATAAAEATGGPARLADGDLDPGELAYRCLGRLLGRQPGDGEAGPIRTRFVVDAIAGTSAGGINGAFLAKALANDQPLDGLKDLWMRKGDLARLLNRDAQPSSLLASGQMYDDLLKAFDALDQAKLAQPPGDGCDIDLWLTATDLAGRSEPLPMNEGVHELRHRHVFQFASHCGSSGDFTENGNPLLAFASRCTSSFPVAFEPMQFADCQQAVNARGCDDLRLRRLFRRWRHHENPHDDSDRAYGDGGYLDNKPFSYVVKRLGRNPSDLPVVRRLLYVEPVPEVVAEGLRGRPDAVANARAALLELPRREGIRADLEAVQERNQQILTALALTNGIEKDVAREPRSDASPASTEQWRDMDLRTCMDRHGAPYGVYHRLKVQTVLDTLGDLAARLSGFAIESAERDGLRRLIDCWRAKHFAEFRVDIPTDGATENEFLLRYDLPYRQRRLAFVIRLLGDLAFADPARRRDLLEAAGLDSTFAEDPRLRSGACKIRRHVASIARDLRQAERQLRDSPGNPAAQALESLAVADETLLAITRSRGSHAQSTALASAWDSHCTAITGFMTAVDEQLRTIFMANADAWRKLCTTPGTDDLDTAIRTCIQRLSAAFDRYDLVLFPIRWGTDMGEMTPVDVIRISPQDAPSLIDERRDAAGRHKLAGTFLNNFGAFLDERWRRNDYLWGRLDACERLIATALPDDPERAATLITQGQESILREELVGDDRSRLADLMAQALLRAGINPKQSEHDLIASLVSAGGTTASTALMRSLLSGGELRRHMHEHYEVDRSLPPAATLSLAGRAAGVAGRMCSTLGDQYPLLKGPAGWLLRLGSLVSTATELALPGGLGWTAMRHWLVLLYLAEGLLIAGGMLTGTPAAVDVGGRLLVLTGGIHLGCDILGQYLIRRGRPAWIRILTWTMIAAVLIVLTLAMLIGSTRLASWLEQVPGFTQAASAPGE